MKILKMTPCTVEIEDEKRYRSTVFLQGDGKWKCLRCDRYRCEHVKWAKSQNITLPPFEPIAPEVLDELIDK